MAKKIVYVEKKKVVITKDKPVEKEESVSVVKSDFVKPGFDPDMPENKQREYR